jgi:hypothetical protein
MLRGIVFLRAATATTTATRVLTCRLSSLAKHGPSLFLRSAYAKYLKGTYETADGNHSSLS